MDGGTLMPWVLVRAADCQLLLQSTHNALMLQHTVAGTDCQLLTANC